MISLKKYLKVEDLNNLKPSTCNFVKMKFIRVSFQEVIVIYACSKEDTSPSRNHDSYVQFHSGGERYSQLKPLLLILDEFGGLLICSPKQASQVTVPREASPANGRQVT